MTPLAPRTLETDRLLLRPFTVADHAAYSALTADPDVMRYLGTGAPATPDIAWRMMAGQLGHWALLGYGIWALERKDDGALIGHAGFIDVYGWPGFEVAYMLGKDYWGQGYAQEAARAALRVAFEDLKKERVISLIRPLNANSIKVAERLGAVREGSVDLMGSPADVYVHRHP